MPSPDKPVSARSERFLRSLERYTKTDMVYLSSGGFWLTVDQIIGAGIAFLLIIAFGHFTSPETYGTYRYLLATFWTIAAFTLTGLPTALSQAVARGFEGSFRRSFLWSFLGSLPMLAIGGALSAYYFLNGNGTLGYGLLFVALLGPFMSPAHLFGPFLAGRKEFKAMTLYGAAFALVPALGLAICMLVTENPVAFFVVYLAGTIIAGFALSVFTLMRYRPNAEVNEDFRGLIGHFSVMNLLSTVAAQVDKLVVFHYLGPVQLAIYTFAVAMPEQIKGLFGAVSVLALPKFATRTLSEIRANFWKRFWAFTGVLFLASLAYALLAPMLFSLFFPKYMEAVIYSQVFALSLALTSISVPIALLQAKAAKRELYAFNILSPVFQIGALVALTATFGLMGTVLARILGRFFSLGLSAVLAGVHLKSAPAESP